jgi:hypothetical protein
MYNLGNLSSTHCKFSKTHDPAANFWLGLSSMGNGERGLIVAKGAGQYLAVKVNSPLKP